MTHGYEFPASEHLQDPREWLTRDEKLIAVRVVGELRSPIRVDGEIYYGAKLEDLTSTGAERKVTRSYAIHQVDETKVSQHIGQEIVGGLDLHAGVALPIIPYDLKASISSQLKKTKQQSFDVSHTQTVLREVTEEITIPAGEDRTLFVYATLQKVQAELVVGYVDYLVLDYSSGRRRQITQVGTADRRLQRQLGGRGYTNEIYIGQQIGKVEYFLPTGGIYPIYDGERELKRCDPNVAGFTPEPWTSQGAVIYKAPLSLMDHAKRRAFRSLKPPKQG